MSSISSDRLWSPPILIGALRVVDVTVILAAAVLAYFLRHGDLDLSFAYFMVIAIGVLLMTNTMQAAKLYVFDEIQRLPGQVYKLSMALPVVLLMLLALGFFTKTSGEFSRVWVALWFAISFVGLVAVRAALLVRLRSWQRRGLLTRNLVIIGAGELGQRLVRHLKAMGDPGVRLVGLFDDRRTRVPDEIEGLPVLGEVEDIAAFTRETRVDEIVIALPWDNEPRITACMEKLKTVPVNVDLCPDTIGFRLYNRGVRHLGGVPMLNVSEVPLSGWSLMVKAIEDRVLAGLIFIVLLPLFAAIAVFIKQGSPGPVFFRQRRYGFNNEVITVYKFRTMVDDAAYADGGRQATRGDPRVTRVGAFLRRHSLDELPQLINVIKGEMSIVGPRPHAVVHNEQYAALIDGYLGRHKVKPGITGWAQVNGLRGETDTLDKMEARVRHDIYYVDNWSLLFDLRILLLTLFVGFRSEHAY
ncbi:MAG: undecaprenyl-phosphate glucose phosphotransferase [Alphaproteobacteria bacterium]